VIIYLAPSVLVLCLLAAATRLRRHIDPPCPGCEARAWRSLSNDLACSACGWSNTAEAPGELERQAA
jgi:hypothetical protein